MSRVQVPETSTILAFDDTREKDEDFSVRGRSSAVDWISATDVVFLRLINSQSVKRTDNDACCVEWEARVISGVVTVRTKEGFVGVKWHFDSVAFPEMLSMGEDREAKKK